jgi:hypothetical protein
MPGRREFLKTSAEVLAASMVRPEMLLARRDRARENEGGQLPGWQPGVLEIHQIDTGRGNAALVLAPDATSILIDAGEAHSAEKTMSPARPDASRRAGEWIARYVSRQLKRIGQQDLDLMLLTHLHGDHVGEVAPDSPQSKLGNYRLTGAADVAEALTVRAAVDRGWPSYDYPNPPADPSARNYIALAQWMARRGTNVQRAQAGSLSQLALRKNPAAYPEFAARVLSVNGEVWTGERESSRALFPPVAQLTGSGLPSENMCCVSLVMRYGNFRYYTGGDLTSDTVYGRYPWHDIESPVAALAGPVTVAVANHHGYFDACGPAMVRSLQPRVWVLPTWHVSHPDLGVLAEMFSDELYAGERLILATGMAEAALLVNGRFSGRLASSEGHVVIRVAPGGADFMVYVIDSRDERGTIAKWFGPFPA